MLRCRAVFELDKALVMALRCLSPTSSLAGAGWPVLLFLVLAGFIQVITDAKLVQIMRHVCRGGR